MEAPDAVEVVVLIDDRAHGRFLGQHGLSILLKLRYGDAIEKVLFDAGQEWEAVRRNLDLLGEDLADLRAVVLSHRHYDHTGGLLGAVNQVGRVNVVAHPYIVRPNFAKPLRFVGMPHRLEDLERAGARLILTRDPLEIVPGVFTTGEVPRHYGDLVGRLEVLTVKEDGSLERDPMLDDQALAIRLEGGGIVVTGCSHSGVANIVRRAKELVGDVRAVIGGFHLIGADEEVIGGTVERLRELGVREVYPGHCTGLKAECALREAFGNRMEVIHSGKVLRFP